MTMRLMIVADDPLCASALRRALRASVAFDVLDGYVEGRAECEGVATRYRPDVVVVDNMRSRVDTLARIGELRGALPAAKIVVLQARMDTGQLEETAAAGADAAIAKTQRLESLALLVREIAVGNVFHAFGATPRALRPVATRGLPELTDRELEVLRLVAAGATNSGIASQLWVTEQTVKFHLTNVYRKLGVANRTEASHLAHVHGLLGPPPSVPVQIARAA
jgi:DNA-binding NarL/FixJ family response regulator